MKPRLQFWLGRAGAGKTYAALKAVGRQLRADGPHGPPLLFLTPEQATFQMERALLAGGDVDATGRAQVLSFQRLAARVLQQTGGGARPRLGELGKRMLLRALIQRHGAGLKLFDRAARRAGFVERLAGLFKELRQYNVTPDDLARRYGARKGDGSPLVAKLHDLHLLYRDFVAAADEEFTDPDGLLNVVADVLPASGVADGARIWVDGFAGFTPQEFGVLRALWSVAERTHVALCLDPRRLDRRRRAAAAGDLFAPTMATYDRLLAYAAEDGVVVDEPVVFDAEKPPRFVSARLRHMERELFRRPGRPFDVGEAAGDERESLRLVRAADVRVEVESAARQILRLARERGWRFRDMAVIVHDLTPYEDLIQSVFHDLGIPYFIDSRRRLAHHPLIELVRSLLEAASRGWPTEAVVRALKTDFFPLERDEADRLENYALEHGIRGRAWIDAAPWRYVRRFTLEPEAPRPTEEQIARLDELNAVRERAVAPLRRFEAAFASAATARDYAAALWSGLEDLDAAATLEQWMDGADAAGRVDEGQEHERAWQGVVQLLDEFVDALGPTPMTAVEFRQIIEAGLESLAVGMVPAGLDQLMVGTVERSRQPDIKAAFVLGAADRRFPPPPGEDVMFTDEERERLAKERVVLGPTSREESVRQQHFLYILLTRASEYLWVSYPATDGQGREQAPAAAWRRLTALFPDVPVVTEAVDPDDDDGLLRRVATADELAAVTARRLRLLRDGGASTPRWWRLYDGIARDPAWRSRALPVFQAVDYRNEAPPLSEDAAAALFGSPLTTSVSRLETFAACPFRHFAQHGLRLREREAWRLDAAAKGTFLHGVLRRFVQRLAEEGRDWGGLSDEEAARRTDEAVDELAPRLADEILLSSARHSFLASVLRARAQRAVWALTEHARRGAFRPVAVEASFGRGRGAWPAFVLDLGDGRGLRLTGQIDRVDAAVDDGGRTWVRVIDYKSSRRRLPVGRVGHGLALQLPLYMAVVQRIAADGGEGPPEAPDMSPFRRALPRAVQPAALLYFPVRDPFLRRDAPVDEAEWQTLLRRALRMEGLLTDDVDVLRLMDRDVGSTSELLVVQVTRDGKVYASSNTASAVRFEALLRHAERTAAALGRDILSGRVDVAPYRIGSERACTYCPLKAVCQFDPLVEGNTYRRLRVPERDEAWRQIEEEAG